MTAMADDEFMTVAVVATVLKLNQQTVRNWIEAGTLPAVRIGRRVRIRRQDFDQLVDRGYRAGSASQDESRRAQDFWSGEGHAEPVSPPD